ncbi:helix-turn-helix domain-containing protein [Streptomyces sp. NPDC059766]|uniref:helix-turn-helix domain-containing protein n=1 Tax=Streptomyces sp. NPDC059766 TaxID=3346940 RepID=UPI0036542861
MPRQHPSSLHNRALDLLAEGRSVKDVAAELHLSRPTVYRWRQSLADLTGHQLVGRQALSVELSAARARIAELERELRAHRRLTELLNDVVPPKGGSRPSR